MLLHAGYAHAAARHPEMAMPGRRSGNHCFSDLGIGRSMSVPFSLTMLLLLMLAAWRDVATRTIPNGIGLLLVATGAVARILEGPSALPLSPATALVLFVMLLIAYTRE